MRKQVEQSRPSRTSTYYAAKGEAHTKWLVQFMEKGVGCAAQALTMTPVVLMTIFMQKWFVRGLTEGVLKM